MANHEGGCLCGDIRYTVTADPLRVTICHCRFCQKSTGGPYLVEPIFQKSDVVINQGTPSEYEHISEGSGLKLTTKFCGRCGTKVYLGFERFPDNCGIYAGTFDDPNWFDRSPDVARHIFLESAQRGTLIPAGMEVYEKHAVQNDGTPAEPQMFDEPHEIK